MKNGSFEPITRLRPDLICLQEVRTQQEPTVVTGYTHYWNHGQIDGYSGTAILSKHKPRRALYDFDGLYPDIADEGAPAAIDQGWKYHKLAEFFAEAADAAITLTFQRVEEISGCPLPPSARKYPSWWYPHAGGRKIADAWINAGYRMKKLDISAERAVFCRAVSGVSRVNIPDAILNGKLPDDAVFELETHMAYIVRKYGLGKNL